MKKAILLLTGSICSLSIFAQSGNVGIGTTTPSSKLTVNGNAAVGGAFAGTAAPANGAIIQGKVGVGTATPLTHLHLVDSATGGSLVGTSNPANIAFRLENVLNGQAMTQHFVTKSTSGATKQAVIGINPDWIGSGVFVIGRDGLTNDILVDLATGHTGMGANPDANIRINLGDSAGTSENPIARVSNISPVATGNKAIIGFNSYNGGGSTWGIGPEQNSTNPFDSKFHMMSSIGGTYIRRMTFDQSGNVGIANTNPTARLDIAGNIKIADGTQGTGKVLVSDATGLASWQSASTVVGSSNFWNILGNAGTTPATNFLGTTDNQPLVIRTNNTEKMRVAANGFVGIGSSAPLANAHIVNTGTDGSFVGITGFSNNIGLRVENTGNGQAVTQTFVTKNNSGATRQFAMGVNPIGVGGSGGGVFVMTRDSTSDFLMDLTDGHIGMGIFPSVNTILDVANQAGTAEFPIIRVTNNTAPASGNTAIMGFNSYNGGGANWGVGSVQNSATSTDSKFHIMWSGGGSYNRNFTIAPKNTAVPNSGFNVGINTQTPNNSLDLGPTFGATVTDVVGKKLAVYNDATGGDFYGLGINPGVLQFHAGATPTSVPGMVLTGTGRVGIGNPAPAVPLDMSIAANAVGMNMLSTAASLNGGMIQLRKTAAAVSGDVWMNFIANGATVGFISSNAATTVAYNTTSDIRLKEHIKSTHFGIADVMKIDVKDYNYKADASKASQTGFIAQQLYTVFPNAVTKGGDDVTTNPWAVDYGKVTPLLTKAIQDQQKTIEALEAKVKALEAQNQQLASVAKDAASSKQAYAELAAQVKEMQQMLGISKITAGTKVAAK